MADWLIPCRPDIYDAEAAFDEYGCLTWHQSCNMSSGDTAWIYVSAPISEIRCKCLIEQVDIPFDTDEEDDGYVIDASFCSRTYRRYMLLRLVGVYDTPALSYRVLLMNGLSGPIRSQRRTTPQLDSYLAEVTSRTR